MNEIRFPVEAAPGGGYTARAFGVDILTETNDLQSPPVSARDTVRCHFGNTQMPFLLSQFTS